MIATFDTYADAESAVDYLSDQHFTVDKLAIVGRDIELVEQIVGRLNYGWAALRGARRGRADGCAVRLDLRVTRLGSAAAHGPRARLLRVGIRCRCGRSARPAHVCAAGRRRDFTSIQSLQPRHYEVLADVEVADEAVRLLTGRTDRKE
ncbi:hypothetical protein GCM10020255_015510 [Rhodococcus baikonurensis]